MEQMKDVYSNDMVESIFAEAAIREINRKQVKTGNINVTMDELMNMKFDVVEHFGMTRKGVLFVMNTVPPVEYGADCQNYTWYQVQVNKDDLCCAILKL